MKCANCGTEFNEGLFCPECGTKYDEYESKLAELRKAEEERKRQEQEIENQKRQKALEIERERTLQEKKYETNCLVSKLIRSGIICFIYIPVMIFFVLCLCLVLPDELQDVDMGSKITITAIFLPPVLLSAIKLLFCLFSFFPMWNRIEKENFLFIRERNIFIQLLFRLGFQLAFTIFGIVVSFIFLLLIGVITEL